MTENIDSLNFKDLMILKQIQKGFREKFFSEQEIKTAEYEHKKLSIIIDNFLELAKNNLHNFHINI